MNEEPAVGVQPWPLIYSEPGANLGIFRARWDVVQNPRTSGVLRRVVLETPDWCNVVALTPDRRVVLVRQYRFGARAVSLEIPGGTVDPGEDHGVAARRELREETGFTATRWRYLGSCKPNPAYQDNVLHHWLAEDAERSSAAEPDEGEDIEVLTMSEEDVRGAVLHGVIRNGLVIAALARVMDLRRER